MLMFPIKTIYVFKAPLRIPLLPASQKSPLSLGYNAKLKKSAQT